MADSNFRGPVTAMGALENANASSGTVTLANVTSTAVVDVQPLDGPSIFYQATGVPDLHNVPFAKDGYRPGQQPAFLTLTDLWAVDNIPQTAATNVLAAAQTATTATNLTLVSSQAAGAVANVPSVAVGVPIVPVGTTVATNVLAIDFGFTTGTTTANSSTVNVADSTQLYLGQWLVIGGAGASGNSLVTQVQTISTTNITSVTVLPVAVGAVNNAPIGQGNLWGDNFTPPTTSFGPVAASAYAHSPHIIGGLGRFWNPREMLMRCVQVSVGTTAATTAITVTGYDIYRNLMTEKITVPVANRAAASSFFGQKAFKYILSAQSSTSPGGANNLALGIGDTFGLPWRADNFGQVEVTWNGCTVPTSLGFLAAYTTAPSTNTTGDVRGTVQVSTSGNGSAAAVATAQVSNNSARLTVIQNLGVWNSLFVTPNNLVPKFGIPQA